MKSFVSDTTFYTLINIFLKSISLISFSLLTKNFSVPEYGTINTIFYLSQLIIIIIIFGQDSSLARYLHHYKENSDKKVLISESLCFQLLLYLLFIIPLSMAYRYAINFSPELQSIKSIFNIILIQLPFSIIISFSLNVFKWTFSRFKFLIISLSNTILYIVLLAIGIKYFNISIQGVFIISLSINIIMAFISIFLIKNMIVRPSKFLYIKKLISYGVPYGLICIITAILPLIERSLILYRFNLYELGLFSAGYTLAVLVDSLGYGFQSAWQPNAFALYDKDNSQTLFNTIAKLFSITMCMTVLLLCGISHIMISFIASENFKLSTLFIFPIAIGFSIQHLSWIFGIGIKLTRRSKLEFYSYLIYLLSTIIGIWYFSGKFNLYGICIGILFGQIIKLFIMSYFANTVYPKNWPFLSIAYIYIVTLLIGFINSSLYYKPEFPVSLSYILGAFFVFIFGWFVLFRYEERKNIIIFLWDIKNKIFLQK